MPFDIPSSVEPEKQKETITYTREKKSATSKHKGRMPLPDHLERVDIIIPPSEDTTGLVKIGEEITEQLEHEPGKLFVKRFIRPKYAKANGEGILIGTLPSSPIEKGIPGPALLALILIQKYVAHLPLYRQIEQFKRLGVEIPSSTMSDWVALCCNLLDPLYEALKKKILQSGYLQADETTIKVLDKNIKGKTHLGYYWVYRDPVSGLVLFDYRKGRGREGPADILKDFTGYLQSDGWNAYENFDKNNVTLIHCMAHARRYFEHALSENEKSGEFALHQIQKLYSIERQAREGSLHTHNERLAKESAPVLNQMHQWLKENIVKVTPQSASGKALAYSCSRWEKLMLYAADGKLEIDNNLVENSIRPIAIGRKNYLFAGSHISGSACCNDLLLLGTCKLKGINPYEWLKNILQILPDYKANRLEELLP
ncbi:MAG: IS66 family transposase [Bacteroidetes bacterium]|nr:IS66 family transposase [Bacteroidota bacterium]